MIKITVLFFLLGSLYATDDRISFRQQCLDNQKYLIKEKYQLDCHSSYHHYNSQSSRLYFDPDLEGDLKIASFNMFNPGNSQTFFKDNALIASLINRFDVVGAVELLPVVGSDLDNNEAIKQFLKDAPSLITDLKSKRDINSDGQVLEAIDREVDRIAADLKIAPTLFRAPGYLKVLTELRKLDPSWALLLTPRGQGASTSNVQELAGFYYRAKKARTIVNQYCKEFVTNNIGSPVSCIPNFGKSFMGKDLKDVFSRRPFMASFRSGSREFNLLVSHVIFTSPMDSASMKKILLPTLNVENYKDLEGGVTKQNYARFAEIWATLQFMGKMKEHYNAKDIILMGDLNIEHDNQFWEELLRQTDGQELFVTSPTSVTQRRYDHEGLPTGGYASNYDHFLFNPEQTPGCRNARRYDFYREEIANELFSKYLIRSEQKVGNLYKVKSYDKMNRAVKNLDAFLKGRKTVKYNRVVWDDYKYAYRLASLKKRVFTDQLSDKTYYRLFTEVLSDHTPVALDCETI